MTDDAAAYDAIGQLLAASAPGSYLVVSQSTAEQEQFGQDEIKVVENIYSQRTANSAAAALPV